MQQYVAFLSGIAVGSKAVDGKTLRAVFERLGFLGVETFFASGNVGFRTAVGRLQPLEAQISRILRKETGHEIDAFIRTPAELTGIVVYQPFPADDVQPPGSSMFVVFLSERPNVNVERGLRACRTDQDDFHINGREIYWLRRSRRGASPSSSPPLAKALRVPATVRSLETVKKLAAKFR